MSRLTIAYLKNYKNGAFISPADSKGSAFPGVSIDSRTVKPDEMFFAIKGDYHDGHKFLPEVIKKGVTAVIVSDDFDIPDEPEWKKAAVLKVPDTTAALGEIAADFRSDFSIPVVAITGTNGKTTTKEMIAAVLSKKFNLLKSPGNFNNQFGLPLTLFRLTEETEAAVVELGASYPGEIALLCSIADPTHGIVTNIGKGHLEFFKTVDEVANTKLALIKHTAKKDGGFINGDDPKLRPVLEEYKNVTSFGIRESNDLTGGNPTLTDTGCWSFNLGGRLDIQLSIPGKKNIYNALAAAAVGSAFGVEDDKIKSALESFKGFSRRMEIIRWKGVTIINDSYNMNPDSLRTALDILAEYPAAGKRYAVLGDMLEIGPASRSEHEKAGLETAKRGVNRLITVGVDSRYISETANISGLTKAIHATGHEQAARLLRRELKEGDLVLIKGSRGSKMEKTLFALTGK